MPKCPKDCHKPNPLIFRRVIIPSALGDDKENPPENGAYCNALVIYEANNAMYLYSSDGIPTKIPTSITSYNDLTDKPMINGVEIVGDVTLEELGITDLVGAEAEARAAADEALQDAIDAETAAREAADREIIGQIPTVNDATLTIQKNGSQVAVFTANSATDTVANIEVPTATSALINDSGYITNTVDNLVNYYDKDETDTIVETEALTRDAADQDLQEQIDAIVASSDVVDIVGTYAELQNYDTSKLHDNDIIKVLTDETRDDATTYYRWDDGTDTFTYIGSEGPYYTKGEADATFVPLTRTINGKGLNSDVVLTAADVGALPSSTVIPTVNDATLTIQKNGTNVATFTANSATNTTANIAVPTKTSDLVNDGSDNTSTYVEADELATVATSGSYNDLTDKPANFELVEMSYGESNAWAKFIAAYQSHKIVYCRASSNTNPATGTQGRKAFMAVVDNAENPTYVEFQYVRSVATKTAAQPVDQVFVYELKPRNGGTWNVTTRNMAPKLAQGTNTTVSYSNGTYTISATGETYTAGSNINISNQNVISAIVPTKTSDLTNDGSDGSSTYVEATDLATVATTGAYSDLTGTPTIPTVNDATLTIQRNGTNVETFTANSSTNKTANIVVPTLTSDLTNDSGFVTDTDYASASTGGVVKVGAGLSITNGVLSVTGGGVADAVEWTNVLNRPSTVSYWTNDAGYITSADLPTKTSDLTNDGSDGTSTYVEADDLATVATSGSYNDLSNKPTIPTVNDATITIQRNSTNVDSFTVNASQNKSINIVVPTKTSDLTNDSNFATTSQIPTKTSDLTNDGADGTSTYVEADGLAAVATSGSYTDLSNKPTIGNATLTIQKNGTNVQTFTANATSNKTANITVPTKTSDLTNDSDFVSNTDYATASTGGVVKVGSGLEITNGVLSATGGGTADAVEWDNVLNKPTFSTVATSGSYNDLTNKPTIPTVNNATLTIQKNSTNVATFTANASSNVTANISVPTATSDLTNDSGFITSITKITNAEIDAIMGVA